MIVVKRYSSLTLVLFSLLIGLLLSLVVWAAPIPKEKDNQKPVSAQELKELLGKDHLAEEVLKVRERLGRTCTAAYYEDDPCFYHIWLNQGLCLRFNEKGVISHIFLYSKGMIRLNDNNEEEYYKSFLGELPNGLSFNDDPDDVVRKLGEPDERSEEIGKALASFDYNKLGMIISFKSIKNEKERPTIARLTLIIPEKE